MRRRVLSRASRQAGWSVIRPAGVRQPGGDRGRRDEVAIGEFCIRRWCRVDWHHVRVVRFPQHKQAGNGTHQLVVNPEATHCVVGGG